MVRPERHHCPGSIHFSSDDIPTPLAAFSAMLENSSSTSTAKVRSVGLLRTRTRCTKADGIETRKPHVVAKFPPQSSNVHWPSLDHALPVLSGGKPFGFSIEMYAYIPLIYACLYPATRLSRHDLAAQQSNLFLRRPLSHLTKLRVFCNILQSPLVALLFYLLTVTVSTFSFDCPFHTSFSLLIRFVTSLAGLYWSNHRANFWTWQSPPHPLIPGTQSDMPLSMNAASEGHEVEAGIATVTFTAPVVLQVSSSTKALFSSKEQRRSTTG